MKTKSYFILLLLITTFCSGCKNNMDNSIVSTQIPDWVKDKVSNEELIVLNDLCKDYKLTFFKPNEKDKTEYHQIMEIKKEKYSSDSQLKDEKIATILKYPRLKSAREGGSSTKLGRVSKLVYSNQGATAKTTVTAYWGYSYAPGKITEINSLDIDHQVIGLGFPAKWSSQGTHSQISYDQRSIDYMIAGAIRYRVTSGVGDVGVEVTLCEFEAIGNIKANVN